MIRTSAILTLAAAAAFAASSALACPYMKQDQVTQAPMSPIAQLPDAQMPGAETDDAPQSAIGTNDIKVLPAPGSVEETPAD